MAKGIIYLIQPAELVGTNRYKIGLSKDPTLDRCKKGYKNGSRYLLIMECDNPLILEDIIKREFRKKYKLIAGREYFEGDETNMTNDFIKLFAFHQEQDNEITNNVNSDIKKFVSSRLGKDVEFNFDADTISKIHQNQNIIKLFDDKFINNYPIIYTYSDEICVIITTKDNYKKYELFYIDDDISLKYICGNKDNINLSCKKIIDYTYVDTINILIDLLEKFGENNTMCKN